MSSSQVWSEVPRDKLTFISDMSSTFTNRVNLQGSFIWTPILLVHKQLNWISIAQTIGQWVWIESTLQLASASTYVALEISSCLRTYCLHHTSTIPSSPSLNLCTFAVSKKKKKPGTKKPVNLSMRDLFISDCPWLPFNTLSSHLSVRGFWTEI